MTPEPTAHRSWLFVPGGDERKLTRSAESGADAVIFDLEDAVVPERRPAARGLLAELLDQPPGASDRWVRVNPLDTADALTDLAAVVRPGLAGVVLPKASGPEDVVALDHAISALEVRAEMTRGEISMMIIATEVPSAVFRLGDLAGASARLRAVTWGAEDLSAALGASTNRDDHGGWDTPYELARSLCLLGAVSAGAQPVDSLHAAFDDDAGLTAAVNRSARQGFTGMLAIHPRQVPIINDGFTPSADDVAAARAVLGAFEASPGAGRWPSKDACSIAPISFRQSEPSRGRRQQPSADGQPATARALTSLAT